MTQHRSRQNIIIERPRHNSQSKKALYHIRFQLFVKFQESNQQYRNHFVVSSSGLETIAVRIIVKPSCWYLTVHHLSYSHDSLIIHTYLQPYLIFTFWPQKRALSDKIQLRIVGASSFGFSLFCSKISSASKRYLSKLHLISHCPKHSC